jgi:hypothetical protein
LWYTVAAYVLRKNQHVKISTQKSARKNQHAKISTQKSARKRQRVSPDDPANGQQPGA